jgi:hypothetical protein
VARSFGHKALSNLPLFRLRQLCFEFGIDVKGQVGG